MHPEKKIDSPRTATLISSVMLTLLAVNPGYTQGENHINLLLCAALCMSPALLLIRGCRTATRSIDIPLLAVCAFVMIFPLIFHPDSIRLSTMLFTCAYCVYFMMFARILKHSDMDGKRFMKLISLIIYAYGIVLVIQQICVLTGLPVFMPSMIYRSPFKLNSLSAEPSHTSVILSMLMTAWTGTLRSERPGTSLIASLKAYPWLWGCWAWTLFSTYNASAFVLFPLPFVSFITRRNIWKWSFSAAVAIIVVSIIPKGHIDNLDRVIESSKALLTFDSERMIDADTSMSTRIIPTVVGAANLQFDSALITGHGADADQREIVGLPSENFKQGGQAGHFTMLYNYGLPCALALWIAIATTCITRRWWWSVLIFLFALQMSADYNMQLMWMIMAFGLVLKTKIKSPFSLPNTTNMPCGETTKEKTERNALQS